MVSVHEFICHHLDVMCCYGQLNVSTFANAEIACRQLQQAEEKWKDRVVGQPSEVQNNTAFNFPGQLIGGNLWICPALTEWIASESDDETEIPKKRRKAREERGLRPART